MWVLPVCVVKCADGLLLAVHGGCNSSDDAGLGAPSQRVPQQAGELGVTIRLHAQSIKVMAPLMIKSRAGSSLAPRA